MNRILAAAAAFCLAVLSPAALVAPALLTSSCIGSKVDTLALFEPAALAWPAVSIDYLHGVDNAEAVGDLSAEAAASLRIAGEELGRAIEEKDRTAIALAPWAAMQPMVARGIAVQLADGEIGPGVAASLTEQLDKFTDTITRIRSTF